MKRRLQPLWALPAIALVLSCPPPASRRPAPAPPPVIPVHVPPGCSENLSGSYVHANNANFRYQAMDDGKTLLVEVHRSPSDGGTPTIRKGPSVRLVRGPNGFFGQATGPGMLASGQICSVVEFPTEVLACDDAGLLLRTAASIKLDETCLPPDSLPVPLVEHRLNRLSASPSPRSGGPDAGPPRPAEEEAGGSSP